MKKREVKKLLNKEVPVEKGQQIISDIPLNSIDLKELFIQIFHNTSDLKIIKISNLTLI